MSLLQFALVVLVIALIVELPGYLVLRAVGLPRAACVCAAPLLGVALISILGVAYGLLGVTASPALMLVPAVVLPAIAFVLARAHRREISFPGIDWRHLAFALILGAGLGYNLFVSRLPQLDSLFQAYDITQHLNVIQAMADSGRYSSLGVSYYLSQADQAIMPYGQAGFYPAAWHAVCALAVEITGATTSLVINASMFVFACLAWPVSALLFFSLIFGGSRRAVFCGALASLSFVSFPWLLLAFGPVYPNLAGFALMPVAMALFVRATGEQASPLERVRCFALLLVGVVGLALLHPNTIFSCVVILAPYCVGRIWRSLEKQDRPLPFRAAVCVGFVAFCVGVWVACFHLPMLQATVTHVWPPFTWTWQAIINVVSQTYTMGFYGELATEFVLAALVLIGLACALQRPGRRWMAAAYLLACYIFVVSVTHSDSYKQLLAGFWYTDPMRLAAMCSIAAMPLAALGAEWVFEQALALVGAYNERKGAARSANAVKAGVALTCVYLLLTFMPSFNLPGLNKTYSAEETEGKEQSEWPKSVHTTFGDLREAVEGAYSYHTPLDEAEEQLLAKVAQLVPQGSLVLNNPMDGSFLAYGHNGVRVYYRDFVGYGGANETAQSRLIRASLCDVASNDEVREAVASVGAQYVLVMSQEGSESSFIDLRDNYAPEDFAGVLAINGDTPGFSCLWSNEAGALYKIEL